MVLLVARTARSKGRQKFAFGKFVPPYRNSPVIQLGASLSLKFGPDERALPPTSPDQATNLLPGGAKGAVANGQAVSGFISSA